jgi:RimJ/RimL family protein N-acetyltransferase
MTGMIELPREAIEADGVRLRPPRETDADEITLACRDPETHRYVHAMPDPYTRQDALWWITEGAAGAWRLGGAAYVIAESGTDRVLGGTGINRVLGERSQGEIGYWVAPWARRCGIATTSTKLLTRHAFAHGFGRLELLTELENAGSQRVALAAGYQYEGVRRGGGVGRDGRRHDLAVWVRLVSDPPGPTGRLLPDLPGGRLVDGTVRITPVRPDDVEPVLRLNTLPEVVETSVPPVAPDRDEVRLLCARAESNWLAGRRADMAIRDAATDTYAGEIGLYYHEPFTGLAMIGYSLLPEWRGKGYATRALRLVARWAFAEAGIARLVAGTHPDNHASQRVLERAGFTREGLARGRLPTADGGRIDDVLYGLLPGDLPTRPD